MDGTNHKAAMAHGDYFGRSSLDAVYDAIVADKDLSDVGTIQFTYDHSGFGEFRKSFDGLVNMIMCMWSRGLDKRTGAAPPNPLVFSMRCTK